jgi:two-component system chemotaxis response regulator CheB
VVAPRSGKRQRRRHVRVLVVDDSAVVRQIMSGVLSQDPNLSVAVAANPLIAMDKMKRARPDVILLDLEMPRMDGLTFLHKLMVEDPIPVVICSSAVGEGSDAALRALDAGAVEIVAKPVLGVADFLQESADALTQAIYAAACARVRPRRPLQPRSVPAREGAAVALREPTMRAGWPQVVAIGASTGGPQALHSVLQALPSDAPGLVIVQHIPEPFTAALARRLDAECRIAVKEAAHGDPVVRGQALFAPGNRHMMLLRSGPRFSVALQGGPRVSGHCPSVEVLFRSVAKAAGPAAVGVILTGMGHDGAEGLREMKIAGARTIAQDEESCIVFGMPKHAISRGAAGEVVALDEIPSRILKGSCRRRIA